MIYNLLNNSARRFDEVIAKARSLLHHVPSHLQDLWNDIAPAVLGYTSFCFAPHICHTERSKISRSRRLRHFWHLPAMMVIFQRLNQSPFAASYQSPLSQQIADLFTTVCCVHSANFTRNQGYSPWTFIEKTNLARNTLLARFHFSLARLHPPSRLTAILTRPPSSCQTAFRLISYKFTHCSHG